MLRLLLGLGALPSALASTAAPNASCATANCNVGAVCITANADGSSQTGSAVTAATGGVCGCADNKLASAATTPVCTAITLDNGSGSFVTDGQACKGGKIGSSNAPLGLDAEHRCTTTDGTAGKIICKNGYAFATNTNTCVTATIGTGNIAASDSAPDGTSAAKMWTVGPNIVVGSNEIKCAGTAYPATATTCVTTTPALKAVCYSPTGSPDATFLNASNMKCHASTGSTGKLVCKATYIATQAGTCVVRTSVALGTDVQVAADASPDGSADNKLYSSADIPTGFQVSAGKWDCAADYYQTDARACAAKSGIALGGTCHVAAGTTAATATLTAAKLQCAPDSGQSGSGKIKCVGTAYPATSSTCVTTTPALKAACFSPAGSPNTTFLDASKMKCHASPGSAGKLVCKATYIATTAGTCVAKASVALGTGVQAAADTSPDGSADNKLYSSADIGTAFQVSTGKWDCATNYYQTGAATCAAKSGLALGGTCHVAAGTTAATATLTTAKLQCVPASGASGAGLLACATGKVSKNGSANQCYDPVLGTGRCDVSAKGTPGGDASSTATKTTDALRQFADPEGFKCVGVDMLVCDIAGGYLPCNTTCTKNCSAGTINMGESCGRDADCKTSGVQHGPLSCVGAGTNGGKCLCPENATATANVCATGTAKAMKVGKSGVAGSNIATGYVNNNAGTLDCALGYVEGSTSELCTLFTGTVGASGQDCKDAGSITAAFGSSSNLECSSNKVKCTSTNVQCTSFPAMCAATATHADCKCALGQIQSNATNNPCVDLKVGNACQASFAGAKNNAITVGHTCTNNVVACAVGYEECTTTKKCVELAADTGLCPAAASSTTATTATATTTAPSSATTGSVSVVVLALAAFLVV